eukprot:COSAG05_NODE_22246_length_266_cov_0.616766_2_plen_33_part_01
MKISITSAPAGSRADGLNGNRLLNISKISLLTP